MDNEVKNVFDAMFGANGAELNVDQLEGVSGGKITNDVKNQIMAGLKLAKSQGMSLNDLLGYIPTYWALMGGSHPETTQAEVTAFIKNNWNKA